MSDKWDLKLRQALDFVGMLGDVEITIGLNEEEGSQRHENGTTLAATALYNEFGTATIPTRPAFRTAGESGSVSDAAHEAAQMLSRGPESEIQVADAMDHLGTELANQIRRNIVDWASPPNAPSTVRRKGFNSPLVETGKTHNSISSIVKLRGRRVRKTFAR